MSKPIRAWRIQAGAPFGVHLWFDPRVEHVALLDGPADEYLAVSGGTDGQVDSNRQVELPWDGISESDRGKREVLRPLTEDHVELPEGTILDIPF